VLAVGLEEFKVLDSVVILDLVLVVNFFARQKTAAEMLLHDQPVLANTIVLIMVRMIWRVDRHVPSPSPDASLKMVHLATPHFL